MATTAGIDVSLGTLDVRLWDENGDCRHRLFTNEESNFPELREWAKDAEIFAMEATGTYHKALLRYLRKEGVQVICLNPRRARQLAEGLGILDKDDKLDALVLAKAAAMVQPEPQHAPSLAKEEAMEVSRRIDQLKLELAKERTRLKEPRLSKIVEDSIRRNIGWLVCEVESLEDLWRRLALADPELAHAYRLAISVPNIGPISARMLVSELPSVKQLVDRKKAVGLSGLAPRRRRSGTSLAAPDRITRCCNPRIKKALYMPAIQALRRSPDLRGFYMRLIAAGKHPKQATVAVMRKIFTRVIAVLVRGTPWESRPTP